MSAAPGLRCAWCHDGAGPTPLCCPACGTLLHPECARELAGRCATLGCAARDQPCRGELRAAAEARQRRSQCGGHDRPLSWTGRALLGLLAWCS